MFKDLPQMIKVKLLLPAFILTSVFVICVCLLAASAQTLRVKPNKAKPPVYHWYNHTEWATEAWTGNDKPYQVMRNEINGALARSPQSGKALLAKYAADYKAHPASPTALFRWAFTSLKLALQSLLVGEDGLDGVRDAFAKPPSPHTYNYTRLRYLLYQHAFPLPDFLKIGDRLLKQQPNDFPVQYYHIISLVAATTPTESQKALVEIERLIQQQPDIISLYALKGSIYLQRWAGEKATTRPRQTDGDLCIAAYQEYLNRAPANDPFRKSAQNVIDWVRIR